MKKTISFTFFVGALETMPDRFSEDDNLKLENLLKAIDDELVEGTSNPDEQKPSKEERHFQKETILHLSDNFELVLNSDKTRAVCRYLTSTSKTPSIKGLDIINQLKNVGIVHGILEKNIQKAATMIRTNPKAELEVVVAQGRPAVPGHPSRIIYWIGNEPHACKTGNIQARKNDLLLKIEPATAGVPGISVYSEEITPPEYQDEQYHPGQNVYVNEKAEFIAARAGHVKFDDNFIHVMPINRNAVCEVTVSEDEMSAMISIEPPMGKGSPLSYRDVRSLLAEHQVCAGIDDHLIHQTLIQANQEGKTIENLCIARGKPAHSGHDAKLRWYIHPDRSKERYTIEADGSINFYSISQITTVKEGMHLLSVNPPSKGTDGFTVRGKRIEGKWGKRQKVHAGENILIQNDGKDWYAACSGKYVIEENVLNIFRLYYVDRDVDFSVGNIDFEGDVVILGNILDGFEVKATGNITVKGTIEAANVNAGKNVEVRQGIFGKEKGKVEAKFDIISSFLQNAEVEAERNVIVSNQILNSVVRARFNVEVKTGKGSIIGGTTLAGHKINARTIGTEYGTITNVNAGTDYGLLKKMCIISEKKNNLNKQLSALNDFFTSKKRVLGSTNELDNHQQQLIKAAKQKQEELQKVIKNLSASYRELAQKLYNTKSPQIHASMAIMPGVNIRIRETQYKVRVPIKQTAVTYDHEKEKIIIHSTEEDA